VDIPLREDAGLTARCALLRLAVKVDRPGESPYINKELARKIGMNPFALAPLLLRGNTVGVLGIDRSHENGFVTEEEFQILQIFANQAAITIGSLVGAGGDVASS
jgi:GAF domain-containing protein